MLTAEQIEDLHAAAALSHPASPRFKNAATILLHHLQDGICAICGAEIEVRQRQHYFDDMLINYPLGNLDHVVAKSIGGEIGLGNVVLTHSKCNTRKGNQPPTGCECIWLLAVNARLGAEPTRW